MCRRAELVDVTLQTGCLVSKRRVNELRYRLICLANIIREGMKSFKVHTFVLISREKTMEQLK